MSTERKARRVLYVSGTRADYGLMRETLWAIQKHPRLSLRLLVTNMHLAGEFGGTIDAIKADGFDIAASVSGLLAEDSPAAMAKSLGLTLMGMAQALEPLRPDFVLLEGDRGESLAAAIAASHMNVAIAHVSGGDVVGPTIDESIRHSITKFAHLHFPGTALSASRILAMGENPKNVHNVGTPGCDLLREAKASPEELAQTLRLDLTKPVLVVVQHPVTSQTDSAAEQMSETMKAISELKLQTVVIYPNSDAGGRRMIPVICEHEPLDFIRIRKSLDRKQFVGLLSIAGVIIGNSSSALVEAPSLGLPAIDIGSRQGDREKGGNITSVAHDRRAIKDAVVDILDRLKDRDFRRRCADSPYKDRDTPRKIAGLLAGVEMTPELTMKRFHHNKVGFDQDPASAPAS